MRSDGISGPMYRNTPPPLMSSVLASHTTTMQILDPRELPSRFPLTMANTAVSHTHARISWSWQESHASLRFS